MGEVVSNPEASQTFYHNKKTAFIFQARNLKVDQNWQDIQGLIRVTVYGEREVYYGDELMLQGSLVRPPGLRNPGGFDYRRYLANHNIHALLKVKERDLFQKAPDPFSRAKKRLTPFFEFKQRLHNIIYRHLEPDQAALLSAILLGERANLSQDVKDLFIKTGTIHILAISGLHVALIALIVIAVLRFFRCGRKLTFSLAILFVLAYAVLSGMRPSVVRATIMAAVVLFGFVINRDPQIYNSLGLAGLIILIFNPHSLFDAGFQLSFVSVISIVYFAPKITSSFSAGRSLRFYLLRPLAVSLAAWIGMAPLVAYYFNIVSAIAVLANLIIIPVLLLVVSAGICFLIFAFLWAPLGAVFAETSWVSLVGLTKLNALFAKLPGGFWHAPKPQWLSFCGYYLLILLIFNYRKLKLSTAKLGIILSLAANFLVWRPLLRSPSDILTVTFLDVGHGDAAFVELPYSEGGILIDGGPGGEIDAGRMIILPFLWNKGIGKIDVLVLSHPDNDHIGGLVSVLNNLRVNYVFDNGLRKESVVYEDYMTAVKEKVAEHYVLKRGERIQGLPQIELLVLNPPETPFSGSQADSNNNSLVLKLVYQDVSLIFCGDIQEQGIEQLLRYRPMLQSTVLKVPHHGSYAGRIEDYLFQAVSPKLAVISVKRSSQFGFPAPEVVEGLQEVGARIYTTADNGAVTISTDGQDLWVETMVR